MHKNAIEGVYCKEMELIENFLYVLSKSIRGLGNGGAQKSKVIKRAGQPQEK